MRLTIITMGSYGDVQPYIALGVGLQAAGHEVCLATHAQFEQTIRGWGLDFFPVAGDPSTLLASDAGRAWLDAGGNPLLFFQRLSRVAKPLLQQATLDCWHAAQNAEALVLSQLAICIAYPVVEQLDIPCCMAFLQPITPTRAFASPFFPPAPNWLGPAYNRLSYFLAVQALWMLVRSSVNTVRRETLHLPPLAFQWLTDQLRPQRLPFLYGYSPHVLPCPADWGDWNHVTGYWFLNHAPAWQPPAALVDFLAAGPPPVYIGFGSMNSGNPQETIQTVLKALARTKQRGVLLIKQSELGNAQVPDAVFTIESIPHDWLFPRMAVIVHHGGAGTTAAALRAGVPSVVIPFFAEQPFWGKCVFELGVGPKPIPRKHLSEEQLTTAIQLAVSDEGMRRRASALGERIRAEDGVACAVEIVERCLVPGPPR